MARPESDFPTGLELEILKILWEESPLPVRDVRARLEAEADRPLAHSSVITVLNIMHRKRYLTRTKQGKSFLFSPKVAKEQISGGFVTDLLSRVFDGSPSAMVLNLLESADVDSAELAEIRKLIVRKAKEQKS
ncbi:Penicillinase repressor [Posidoniimonas corsicana]|uniref:Penicillinase repressor n=1 Tax=Posidoniimonas corsicana TaxID=1938618 RepID=A0A5C5VD97_9BACT|nr:BlaI/MecI/CopY family transcriptional regulator [Posidoniimonas corsicana]TWT35615.1 Penicillinase repressor [Posidoniimonas corsicana]